MSLLRTQALLLATALATLFALTSCEDEPVDPDNNPNDTTQTDPTARNAAIQNYNDVYLASEVSTLGWTGDADNCEAGSLPQDVHDKVLMRINYYRSMAGLEAISGFRSAWNTKSQEAALMMQANSSLDHSPPNSWSCYTDDGAEAAGKANLSLGTNYHTTRALDGQMRDAGSGNFAVGHRRWILYSRGEEMGHGSTNRSMVLWVIGGAEAPATMPEMIPWPPQGYVPKQHVWPRWSLGVPGGDFSNASVSMSGPNGNVSLSTNTIQNGFGDNTIVWEPNIDASSISDDETYSVTVSGVEVGGESKDFSYQVTIIDPANTQG